MCLTSCGQVLVHFRSFGRFLGRVAVQSGEPIVLDGGLREARPAIHLREGDVLISFGRVPLRQREEVLLQDAMLCWSARLGRQCVQLVLVGFRGAGTSLEWSAVAGRSGGPAACQLVVICSQFASRCRRLIIQSRQAFAVRAHAKAQVPAWVANEALGHAEVSLGLRGIAITQSGEMCAEACMVRQFSTGDQLLYFKTV